MKKKLLSLIFFSLLIANCFGQFPCAGGLSPNAGNRGQTLYTSVTPAILYMGYGSAPCNPGDIYLNQSSSGTTIYASTLSIVNDSVNLSFQIPSNAPAGVYDMHMDLYNYDPNFGNCLIGPHPCVVPGALGIDVSQISGHVFYDSNQDSVYNTGDSYLQYQSVRLLPNNSSTWTDQNGYYHFFVVDGNYIVRVDSNYYFYPTGPDSIPVTVAGSNVDSVDFGIYPSANSFNTWSWIYGRARCNTNQDYDYYIHSYSYVPVDLVVKLYHKPNMIYTSAATPPDSIVGDTLYFHGGSTFYGYASNTVYFDIPNAGDTVSVNLITESYDQSGTLMNHEEEPMLQLVSCSWDPNDKAVTPEGEMAQHYTLFGEDLYYNIRFQNTGSDTAYQVHILDTLDSDLDLNSFQLVSSSDPVTVELDEQSGIVDFWFYNIMLPDSNIDEPGSHGFVSYAIQTKTGLPANTLINNRAHIYFDQNVAVTTNETDNLMVYVIPVGIESVSNDENVSVYPNPVSQALNIRIKNNSNLQNTFTITDMSGREIVRQSIKGEYSTIDVSNLSSGIYMYRLINNQNNNSNYGRIVKY